jgi:transposase
VDVASGWPLDEPSVARFAVLVDGAVRGMVQYAEEEDEDYRHASIDVFLDRRLPRPGGARSGGGPGRGGHARPLPGRRSGPPPPGDRPGGRQHCSNPLLHRSGATLLIAYLTGAAPSTGWVSAQVARTAEALTEVEALIKTLIALAAVIGVDETTVSIAGRKSWLHVARTDLLTAYHLHASRGRTAVQEFGVLPTYRGTVMHDALAVYDTYPATHALCGAHLLRELTAVAEAHPEAIWPGQAGSALADLNLAARTARQQGLTGLPAGQADGPLRLFRHAVLVGLAEHPRAAGRKQSKARNLLERLRDREDEILRFTVDLAVPFTNNGSERDLRPVKTQIKISGCHRAATGATAWLRVRGYISTVRKHGDNVLTALRDAVTGNPWTPPAPAT